MAAVATIVGTVFGLIGANKQAKAAKRAEALRQRQMNLEAMRQKRQLVREGIVARANATNNAVAQGAAEGSGLAGGIATVTGNQNRNVQAVNQDTELSNGIFAANKKYASGGTLIAIGQGISSLGSAFQGFNFGRG